LPNPDAIEWNARYETDPQRSDPRDPRTLLTNHLDMLPARGLAVDMACGTSASGLFLASRGWQVIGLDVAESALRIAQARARSERIGISLAVFDLTNPWLPECHFDIILNFYFLVRPLWALYKKAIKPGGLLFFETFLWQPTIEIRPERYLQPGELKQAFSDWDILLYEETDHHRYLPQMRRCARLIARRSR
jgi:hypothetical protein